MSSSGDDQRASFPLPGFPLQWLALQYVLDELSVADRDAFEARLADDLTACEAVAAASRFVLTSQAAFIDPAANSHAASTSIPFAPIPIATAPLATAPPATAPLAARPRTEAAGRRSATGASINSWLAVVATSAAMAMLLLFTVQAPVPLQSDAEIAQSSLTQSSSTRSGSRVADVEPRAAELVSLWRSGMDASDDDADDMEDLADVSSDVAVPGWLLAAVSFEAPGPVEGSREKLQEN